MERIELRQEKQKERYSNIFQDNLKNIAKVELLTDTFFL